MNFRNLARIGFEYRATMRDINGKVLWRDHVHNLFPIEGINYVLGSSMGPASKITTFYMGIFEGNYTPLITDTAAAIAAAATECTAYNASSRQTFTPNAAGAVTGGVIDNVGNEAQFTFNANKTIYGGFISSGQAKGSTLGVLLSIARFTAPQVAVAGNVLTLAGGCTLVNA